MPESQTIAVTSTVCVWCNTAPLCLYTALVPSHLPAILIPPEVSLSKTVTQSLSRPLSLSLSVSQPCPIPLFSQCLAFSVCQSPAHSVTPSLSPYLHTSLPPPLTHLHFPPIHHSTRLSCQVFTCQQPTLASLSLYQVHFLSSESPSCFLFFSLSCLYFKPPQCFIFFDLEQLI